MSQRTLWSDDPEAAKCLKYLREKRKLSDKVIRDFNFGYVPTRVGVRCGADEEKQGGVDISGRIIMPYYDSYGSLFMITTRDVRANSYMPHFHESLEKGHHLFGLNIAKQHIIKKKKAIVVEGQFDIGYLHSLGFNFSVAILGSAMTLFQISLLCRYCSEIYLLFDGDEGGMKCTKRTMEIYRDRYLYRQNIKIIPVALSEDLDPDDLSPGELVKLFKESKKRAEKEYVIT